MAPPPAGAALPPLIVESDLFRADRLICLLLSLPASFLSSMLMWLEVVYVCVYLTYCVGLLLLLIIGSIFDVTSIELQVKY